MIKILFFLLVAVLSIISIVFISTLGITQPLSMLLSLVVPGVITFLLLITFKALAKYLIKSSSKTYNEIASRAFHENDFEKAKKYFKDGCKFNDPKAYCGLAYMYDLGKGVKQDYFKAKDLYQKACELGSDVGCHNLGVLYERGNGVEQDYKKARELYERASSKNYALSYLNLGILYHTGMGVKINYPLAKEYYEKAISSEVDDPAVYINLGVIYEEGLGTEVDISKALTFFKKACGEGEKLGCSNYENLLSHQKN